MLLLLILCGDCALPHEERIAGQKRDQQRFITSIVIDVIAIRILKGHRISQSFITAEVVSKHMANPDLPTTV